MNIKYIGADDADLKLFESQYDLPDGMCYNSYLVLDDKVAIIDSVDNRKVSEWLDNLENALEDRHPDYLVVQHMEPDHSAGIAQALEKYPNLQIVGSAKAIQMMSLYFEGLDLEDKTITVKDGDTLNLGSRSLQFLTAPMVHWPEVIVTYDPANRVLFSADAFGKFGVREADPDDWACEARRYYFNICGKYGTSVAQLLRKVEPLDIEHIFPLHGPMLQGEALTEALRLYGIWSRYDVETPGVFVAYASIHGGTREAAVLLSEMLRERGVPKVSVSDLTIDDQAEAIEDAFRMSHLVCCSASYDAGLFPPMHDFIHHLRIKAYQRRTVALIENGSWAPSAGRVMREMFADMKDINLVEPLITIRGRLHSDDRPKLQALADSLAKDFVS
ncbi:MAG: FprA family A-type flavoprotein [Bacteroidaceae bacterium]|nr:FprA family A-type flavoprotein [Bacteroidaceae bacterium]